MRQEQHLIFKSAQMPITRTRVIGVTFISKPVKSIERRITSSLEIRISAAIHKSGYTSAWVWNYI